MDKYYLQNGYVGNAILWWATDSHGYTTDLAKAHRFTKEEAVKQVNMRSEDKAWECSHVDQNEAAHREIIDSQYLDPQFCIRGVS